MIRSTRSAGLLDFTKYNCAGNDFVLIPQACPTQKLNDFIKAICRPQFGVGADGVIFVWKKTTHWQWRFFNADGSETALCGNATRAVGDFLSTQREFKNKKESLWKGRLGLFHARSLRKESVEVCWPLAHPSAQDAPDELLEQLSGFNDRGLAAIAYTNVGVPHLVLVNHENWSEPDRFANNPTLRSHPVFGKEGANVTWYSRKSQSAVTFERGVERETLACGSGALALYLTLTREHVGKKMPSLEFKFPGGILGVRRFEDCLWLSGPVKKVFEGKWYGS